MNSEKSKSKSTVKEDTEPRGSTSKEDTEPRGSTSKEDTESRGSTSKEDTEPRGSTSKEDTEPRGSTSKENTEPRGSTSKEDTEPRGSTSKEDTEPRGSTSKEDTEPRGSTSKEDTEPRESTSKEDTVTRGSTSKEQTKGHKEENKQLPGIVSGTSDKGSVHVRPQITITAGSPSSDKQESPKGKCPIYFGIKSYLHNFYDPPDKDVINSGEYIQEDDFEFLVEPGKRRWKGRWFRTGLWAGINLILLGIIALLVGHLTPPRNTVVGHQGNLEILDRWAINFNRRLEMCRVAGLVVFCCGGVVVMVTLLVSSYQQDTAYYVMGATIVPEMLVEKQSVGRQRLYTGRIPVTGSIRSVQPIYLCPKIK